MAVITCQHCELDNEIPDDEICPGYSAMYEALKDSYNLLKRRHKMEEATSGESIPNPLLRKIEQALANLE